MRAIADLLDIVPGWLYAVICASLFAWGGVQTWQLDRVHGQIKDMRLQQAEAESDRLREANKEVARLVGITNNLNEAHHAQLATIDDLERRAKSAGLRLTKAERDAAIAQGSTEAVRHYASTAGDVYQACRDEYRSLGYEAARGSAAAHALKQWADQWPATFDEAMTMQVEILKGTAK